MQVQEEEYDVLDQKGCQGNSSAVGSGILIDLPKYIAGKTRKLLLIAWLQISRGDWKLDVGTSKFCIARSNGEEESEMGLIALTQSKQSGLSKESTKM